MEQVLQALPPECQMEREREAIEHNLRIQQFLAEHNQSIREIVGSIGKWRVYTEQYAIDVDVIYIRDSAPLLGPGQIELIVWDPICLE